MTLYLGLISGTSMDAIDAALVDIEGTRCTLTQTLSRPYAESLRTQLFTLIAAPQRCSLDDVGRLDTEIGEAFATTALDLLQESGVAAARVQAIGSHGQTLRHQPLGEHPFTWQVGNPHLIAERTGITTVADFRRRDVAAGGEGAPLMPAFHQAVLASPDENRAVINIGGIANLTWLPRAGTVIGFDTGPGNCLMDAWATRHLGVAFDREGAWAANGRAHAELLEHFFTEPYFAAEPPKSTGRELFNMSWLEGHLGAFHETPRPEDVQATLCELTARSLAEACRNLGDLDRVLLCGGGSHNLELRRRLGAHLPRTHVETTAALGLDPDHVEATGFAWLAYRALTGLPGNLPAVTGAQRSVILGAIHPGRTVTNS
ncbi:MAG TPA: anhydro-N-acetylmuramic acid kinase [Steroidobacteraceae bacterium]|nr:anhydro-N-acetylmuramic acid kinase [Steroidobacteraceae bacterium]